MPTHRQSLFLIVSALTTTMALAASAPRKPTAALTAADALCAAESAPVAPAVAADAGCRELPVAAPARPGSLTHSKVFHQVRYHARFPASRPAILEGLHTTSELTANEEAWLTVALPRRTFRSGADVMAALFPGTP